ncbi:MAG: hypothetical protein DCC55_16725 [Chloroflexi bacterium]|nr:MAG: hypothetical protein DCC55_16725 [Chloroflexota bacterium]
MEYVFLIYSREADRASATPEQMQKELDEYNAFTKDVLDRGVYVAAEALQPTQTATTVRLRDGKVVTTDGPFAETKEQLGGLYVINCKDLDEAIAVAARIPSAKRGSIEVRPIMDFGLP